MPHPIRAALEAYALASARVFATDRTQTVGASEIGACSRKTWYAKNEADQAAGVARDEDAEDRWGAKVRGSVYEDAFWVPALRATFGERLRYAGTEQITFVSGFLSATPDGLIVDLTEAERDSIGITDASTCVALDCKTADPRTKLDKPKDEHAYQIQVQLGLIRELTPHRPTHGILSYTDASFWDEVKTFTIAFDPAVYEHAKSRARQIMTALSAGDLPPEGVIAGGAECDRCAFTAACGQRRAELVPKNETRVEMTAEIATLARDARGLRQESEGAMKEAREVEHELRGLMAAAGARRMAGSGLSISWSALAGRPSLDTKGLKAAAEAAGIDVASFSRAGEASDRLVITLDRAKSESEKAAS